MGRMAVFADPTGAVISAWQAGSMRTFHAGDVGTYGWAEVNARGIDKATDFYRTVFGWQAETSPMGEGQPDYTTFSVDGEQVAGGMEMMPMVPTEVPSYWMIYFNVADVDAAFARADRAGRQPRWSRHRHAGRSLRDRQRSAGRDVRTAQAGRGLISPGDR